MDFQFKKVAIQSVALPLLAGSSLPLSRDKVEEKNTWYTEFTIKGVKCLIKMIHLYLVKWINEWWKFDDAGDFSAYWMVKE